MNTIDDLRATLADHAELHDAGLAARSRAVAGRVRTVRRRRTVVAAGTAAVVLGGVVAGVAVVGRPDPADDRLLVGAPVPAELVSTGYTYELVDGTEAADGETKLRVEVPEADVPRLVSWATEGDGQRVEVDARWSDPFVSGRPDFTDFVVVPADEHGWVEVSADTRVALATYELGDERPAGHTEGGVTFRQQREGAQLVDAVIGERGETSVSLTLTLPEGRLMISDVCQATEADDLGNGPWMETTVDGDGGIGTSCNVVDRGFVDPGGGWSPGGEGIATDTEQLGAGDEVTLTSTLTAGPRSADRVEDPEALLGIAVYVLPDDSRRVAGSWVPRLVEHDGHTWALTTVERTQVPAPGWSVPVPASDERLLVGLAQRFGGGTVTTTVDGQAWGSFRGTGSGWGVDGTLPEGAREVGLRTSEGATGEAALLFYELVH